MFKKRSQDKKTDITKDLQSIQIPSNAQNQGQKSQQAINQLVPKSIMTKKINKFSNLVKKQQDPVNQPKKPIIVKYGLIDKQQVNSKYHATNQQSEDQKHPQKHSIVNLYVKKKMQELAGNKEQVRQREDANAQQIIQMQKKYLQMGQQKLAEYDIVEILKKLQNMATASIKSQIQNRNNYLKNLLENQHEKMQYASKKQLKTIRQQKQRLQHEFQSKYNDDGRRGYVQKMKYSALFGK